MPCSRLGIRSRRGIKSRILAFAAKHQWPVTSFWREWVGSGRADVLWAQPADLFRRAATYVDKILKGAKPAGAAVEQPMKFDLIMNLKTAKALGLTIPPSLLLLAAEVIQ